MRIKLLSLKLKNFKGIRDFTLDAEGRDIRVFGDNATGKTTLADAFMWLLFGKDSSNRKDFEIKTLGPDGEPEHGLEHTVEAELELDDEKRITLKKVYKEKWTKKRGSAKAEFTGHTTDHFLNGVPVKKKEYDERIAEIADENIFRLLTDPTYFNQQLHWQKRRELLLEVCGDVSDAEVIASKKELGKLADILEDRTIEQHRKVIQAKRSEINKELEKIPVRIDEVQRNLPDISDISNIKELPNDIGRLRLQLEIQQERLAQAKAGGQVAEKTKELREIEGKLLELKNQHRQQLNEKVAGKQKELSSVQGEIYRLKADIESRGNIIRHSETEVKTLEEKMGKLRQKWHEENQKEFEFEQSETCPTCGQPLPEEQLQKAREKVLADFNRAKAEKLESISAEGRNLKELKTILEEKIEQARQGLETSRNELSSLEQKETDLKAEIDAILNGAEPVEGTPEYIQLKEQAKNIQEEISTLQANNNVAIMAIQKEIDELNADIAALEQAAARLEAREKGLKRIEELKTEERKLAAEYEELEEQLYLTEEFIRTKVRLLENKINSKFKMARFKLFNTLVNGGVEECCETTYKGVPYSNLNNGARLNIGLDIINTLSEHYNFTPPIWLDNAESVTDILPTGGQQIQLIVSEKDKKLRIEGEE